MTVHDTHGLSLTPACCFCCFCSLSNITIPLCSSPLLSPTAKSSAICHLFSSMLATRYHTAPAFNTPPSTPIKHISNPPASPKRTRSAPLPFTPSISQSSNINSLSQSRHFRRRRRNSYRQDQTLASLASSVFIPSAPDSALVIDTSLATLYESIIGRRRNRSRASRILNHTMSSSEITGAENVTTGGDERNISMSEKMKENVKPSALNWASGLSSNRARRSGLAVVRRRSGNLGGELLEKRKVSH